MFILCFLAGGTTLLAAESIMHEIAAFILFLIGAVFFSSAAIVDSVVRLRRAVDAQFDKISDTSKKQISQEILLDNESKPLRHGCSHNADLPPGRIFKR